MKVWLADGGGFSFKGEVVRVCEVATVLSLTWLPEPHERFRSEFSSSASSSSRSRSGWRGEFHVGANLSLGGPRSAPALAFRGRTFSARMQLKQRSSSVSKGSSS